MLKKLSEKRGSAEGFTLIELLVVIVILAVLAAVVVFAVGGITDKGQTSACKADANTIRTAEEAYFANDDTGSYTDMTGLVDSGFLSEAATLHAIHGLPTDGTPPYDSFTLTALGKCA